MRDELKVPLGLDRGLRARGVDPDVVSGPEFVLGLLELFGYKVTSQGEPDVYMATKANVNTFIRTRTTAPASTPS